MQQRYTIELTSDEITELVAALHAREIAVQDAITLAMKRRDAGVVELQYRLLVCKSVADRVRVADKP